MPKKNLFFIALIPPLEIQEFATEVKQHFAEVYNSRAALRSPPHVTLQPPFEWESERLPLLQEKLREFAQNQPPIPMTLHNYKSFKPRVIYINVIKSAELVEAQKNLSNYLESSLDIVHLPSKNRPFAPHLTVAFRDLTKDKFHQAWKIFREKELYFNFLVSHLTLLRHGDQGWVVYQQFPFADDR
jgi:2'-5' RNA ligase